jgi:hypothetical protein
MASLDDILTTQKNGVVAINSISQTSLFLNGKQSRPAISATTVVSQTSGRIVRVAVLADGITMGTIYDASSAATASAANAIAVIPLLRGIYEINMPVVNGIVITPGTTQIITAIYS